MIYNFNLGIGWASSGVEYAQVYRARMLRNIGAEAKFIFTDIFCHMLDIFPWKHIRKNKFCLCSDVTEHFCPVSLRIFHTTAGPADS